MVNWGAVGAIAGVVAILEVPVIILLTAGTRWVKDVNKRLRRIEARSHERRAGDPP
jgi:hypothetical protein